MSINFYSMYDGAYNSSMRRMSTATFDYQKYLKQVSSGIKINSAGDDAAGLALSTKLNTDIMANNVVKNNTQTGINMLNTAGDSIGGMVDSLQKIRGLALQAANGVYTDKERGMIQQEITALSDGIKQSYNSAKFGDKQLFGSAASANTIKIVSQITGPDMTSAGYDDAHIITSASDFVSKIVGHENENFILAGDVDLSSLGTLNHSVISTNFSGQLDGNGHVVSGLNIDTAGATVDNVGLFSQVSGTVKNLELKSFSVQNSGSGQNTGGLVGYVSGGTLDNCSANGNVSGAFKVGVLAGYNDGGGNITYCSSSGSGTLNGANYRVGGLLGCNDNGSTVSNSYSSASASNLLSWSAGGLVGANMNSAVVSSCYATGDVTSSGNAGGLVGYNVSGGVVKDSYATGNVVETGGTASGGVVGWNNSGGTITSSYTTSNVTGTDPTYVGGVAGECEGSADNTNFYKNNMSSDGGSSVNANVSPLPTGSWDTNVWDLSGSLPTLKSFNSSTGVSGNSTALQVGVDASDVSQININMAFTLGNLNFNVGTANTALGTVDSVDKMIDMLNNVRTNIGAQTSKLTNVLDTQDVRIDGYSSAKSTIMDTDMAYAQTQIVKNQLLQNFTASIFKQAKNINQNLILSLLQN